jgi:hypothetical protein
MTEIRQDLTRTAEDLAKVAAEAAYVAIGIGVLGFHKAQVRRRKLAGAAGRASSSRDLEGTLAQARKEVAKRVKDLDSTVEDLVKTLDSTLDPVWERRPEQAQSVVKQARETRDQLRRRIRKLAA